MSQIQLGVLYGGEHFHRNILPVISKINKINIVGVHTRNKKKYNNSKLLYQSKNKILNDKNINTIYISSPNSFHASNIIGALKKNKNVICEKPLCLSLKDYNKIFHFSSMTNKTVFEGFMFIYHDMFNYIIKVINKDQRKIKNISAKFMFPHLKRNNIRYKKQLGGGAFYDCGCYLFKFLSLLKNYKDNIKKKPKIIYSKNFKIDTYGKFTTKISNTRINLEWGFGYKYINQVIINFGNKKIIAERFFSKNSDNRSKIKLIFENKRTTKISWFKKQNHFKSMFLYYLKMLKSNKLKTTYRNELENYQNIFLNKIPYKK